jgi:hypothetical protein
MISEYCKNCLQAPKSPNLKYCQIGILCNNEKRKCKYRLFEHEAEQTGYKKGWVRKDKK